MIAPGSQTTLAQLGLPESFTPARLRIPTRMFPAEKKGEWEPLKVRKKAPRPIVRHEGNDDSLTGEVNAGGTEKMIDLEEDVLYEEDPTTEEGAVFPLRAGKIVNWSCFFALLTHIYNTLSPPFHTPILLISQPAWTAHDHERLTQFFFEKFKTPAFCLMDSALAVCYAYAVPTATVIDVGHGKCDITAISDFLVNDLGRATALAGCGGEAMTDRLYELLAKKGFTRDMCEQLKRSNICEILLPGTELPGEGEDEIPGSATSVNGFKGIPIDPIDDDIDRDIKDGEDNEGVLDVASIVVSGKTSEWVTKKEREKAEKAAAKKAAADTAAAPKVAKLPNAKRVTAILHYNERKPLDELGANGRSADGRHEGGAKRHKTPEAVNEDAAEGGENPASVRKEERRRNRDSVPFVRRDIEVGVERFQATTGGIMDKIADATHRCILSVPDIAKRSELWDSLIILGNASKIKGSQTPPPESSHSSHIHSHKLTPINIIFPHLGFKEALLSTLTAKYLISPSSATIFISELPSNLTTPVATGANTPLHQPHGVTGLSSSSVAPTHTSHGPSVNPLLLAATTASNHLAPPGHSQQLQQYYAAQQASSSTNASALLSQNHHSSNSSSGHGQTPTSIKTAKMPEYFLEWKDVGTEEVGFLGAQVAAKVVFVVDQGSSKGFMSRTEYNELGPMGIHECCL